MTGSDGYRRRAEGKNKNEKLKTESDSLTSKTTPRDNIPALWDYIYYGRETPRKILKSCRVLFIHYHLISMFYLSLIKHTPKFKANTIEINAPITLKVFMPDVSGISEVTTAMPEITLIVVSKPLLCLKIATNANTRRTQLSIAVISGPKFA